MTILLSHANAIRIPLADESVHCVVTSPPYWGLRDYSLPPLVWGGDAECQHVWGDKLPPAGYQRGNRPGDYSTSSLTNPDRQDELPRALHAGMFCQLCGAWLGGLGLEPMPELYVEHLVKVFQEVKRVLRSDGVVFLNLGDSYASQGGRNANPDRQINTGQRAVVDSGSVPEGCRTPPPSLKPKDLVGIPWRVAFALQADGWWLRSDIIWSKPNCMPESVQDRPTKSHEYLFLLSKSQEYYYDAEAIREGLADSTLADSRNATGRHTQGKNFSKYFNDESPDKANPDKPSWYRAKTFVNPTTGRNKRSVWTITTEPYRGAHFATYPPALVKPCIQAGTSERGCCPTCGAPWERVVEKPDMNQRPTRSSSAKTETDEIHLSNNWAGYPKSAGQAYQDWRNVNPNRTIGWLPTCDCYGGTIIPHLPEMPEDAEPPEYCEYCGGTGQIEMWGLAAGRIVTCSSSCRGRGIIRKPNRAWLDWQANCETINSQRMALLDEYADRPTVKATVLDPFVGSGTTLLVARALGRHGIGLDMSLDYLTEQARPRLELDALAEWENGKKAEAMWCDLPLFLDSRMPGITRKHDDAS